MGKDKGHPYQNGWEPVEPPSIFDEDYLFPGGAQEGDVADDDLPRDAQLRPEGRGGDGAGGGAQAFEDRLPPSGRVHETSLGLRLYGDRSTDPAPRGASGDTPT